MKIGLLACFLCAVIVTAGEEKLGFAFEVVRHGARNTFIEGFTEGFPVASGMLTP